MKVLMTVALLLVHLSHYRYGVVSSQQSIRQRVVALLDSEPNILSSTSLAVSSTIQSEALRDAENNLPSNPTNVQLRNYYALACIFRATNGKANPRTQDILGAGAVIPPWIRTDGDWITNADYCVWYGIACDSLDNVSVIKLPENNLYGSWPNEVVLLKNSLKKIEVFNNAFLHSFNPAWLQQMGVLEYLYFGSTSWTFNGVPTYLSGCKNLIELDMSKTQWTNGPIRGAAFQGLTKLEYLDMADNVYTTDGQVGLPSQMLGLVSLENLYLDNCEFQPSGITLDFLKAPNFPMLLELWMDYTKFDSSIPSTIGAVSNVVSFSCTYCGLTGTIPTEIGNLPLDRMWLYSNELSGNLPTQLGRLSNLVYLFLEENNFVGSVPPQLCQDKLQELGADCDLSCNCCTCCGESCGNLDDPALPSPTPSPTKTSGGFGAFCFSGDSTVVLQNKETRVPLSQVKIGDLIQVGPMNYEPIYSFGHLNPNAIGEFHAITTESGETIILSSEHMLHVNGRYIPASMVNVGDLVVTASGASVAVTRIRENVKRKGLYAPFTASGRILVNGILASNYIAFQGGSDYFSIGSLKTPFTHQWLAHAFNSVHRIYCQWMWRNNCGESYTEDGTSHWVDQPLHIATWFVHNTSLPLQVIGVSVFALVFGAVSLLESGMVPLLLLLVATATRCWKRWTIKQV